jgi:hypothetical protein
MVVLPNGRIPLYFPKAAHEVSRRILLGCAGRQSEGRICGVRAAIEGPASGIFGKPWRRILGLRSRRVPRCRGCGGRSEPASHEALSSRQTDKRGRTVSALCMNCRSFVEQMNQDARIMAVFIFRLGKEPRYYPGFQTSTPQGGLF